MNNLLENLLEFYKEDPTDTFTIYGLAMEYWKTDLDKATFYFELLLKDYPEYLATYYQAGKLYQDQEKWEQAEAVFKKGMLVAEKQGNFKTLDELKRAYRMLLDEMEDY